MVIINADKSRGRQKALVLTPAVRIERRIKQATRAIDAGRNVAGNTARLVRLTAPVAA